MDYGTDFSHGELAIDLNPPSLSSERASNTQQAPETVFYKVGSPDPLGGLYQIAQYFKVPFEDLKAANPELASKQWKLWGGEVLVIPLKPGQAIPPMPKGHKP